MNSKIIYFACCILLFTSYNKAQNTLENVLLQIEKNNTSIKANQQYAVAKNLQYKTGITLQNPSVEFEYLNGSPANAGNQTDFSVKQLFDFPTAYSKKNQVAELQIEQTNFQLTSIKQAVLLNAKQTCIELVYHNKTQIELEKRVKNAESLYRNYQKKLDSGEANILDVNKTKLQSVNLQNHLRFNSSQIKQLKQKLTQLNGGVHIEFNDTVYQIPLEIAGFNVLLDSIEVHNPTLKLLEQKGEINQKKVELSKAMALPKLAAGYRYQSILGQQFQGVHVGLTIPLWENKNTVKFQEAQTIHSKLKIEEHKNQYHSQIQQLYEKYQNLNITLNEYKQILAATNNTVLLEKALKLGEISSIQYFIEINYFYSSFDTYLKLEMEYYLVIAELHKYRL